MTILEHLGLVEAALKPFAKAHGGDLQLCSDPADVLQRLLSGPQKLRLYLQFQGQTDWDEDSDSTWMRKRTFLVIVSRGRGLALDPSTNLVKGQAGGEPLYDLLEEIERLLRQVDFEPQDVEREVMDAECTVQEVKIAPWRGAQDLPMDAFEIEFSLATDLAVEAE